MCADQNDLSFPCKASVVVIALIRFEKCNANAFMAHEKSDLRAGE